MTVGFVVLLLKCAFVELFEAEGAHKVFWVKLFVHGCDAAACDWFMTACAQRALSLMVVGFTVGKTFMIIKAAPAKRYPTLLKV